MFSPEEREGCSLSTSCRLTKDGKKHQKEGLEDQDKLSALQGIIKNVFYYQVKKIAVVPRPQNILKSELALHHKYY